MKKGFYIDEDRQRLLIQGDRQLLVLYPREIIQAVLSDEDLYIKANKRGKNEIRTQKNEYRTNKRNEDMQKQIQKDEAEALRNSI